MYTFICTYKKKSIRVCSCDRFSCQKKENLQCILFLNYRSLIAKKSQFILRFCNKGHIKIRHPMHLTGFHHPVVAGGPNRYPQPCSSVVFFSIL